MEKQEDIKNIYTRNADVVIIIEGDRRTNEKIKARKAMCIMLYATEKMSINKIAKIFGMCQSLLYRWINEAAEKLPDYKIKDDAKEIEFMRCGIFYIKKRKLWVIMAFDKTKNKIIAWGLRVPDPRKPLRDYTQK